jgi:PST family polysaccharide transporter
LISGTTVPLSVIAVLTAPELIEIFLGDQWRRAGVIFALLSPLAATQAISSVAFWLLTACGQSKILFRFSAINALMAAASVWVGVQYSLEAGALAFSGIGLLVRTPLLYAATVAHTPISWNDLLGNAGLLILSGLLLGASGLLIRYGVLELTYPSYIWAAVAAGVVALTWIPVAAAQGLPAMLRQLYATLRST